ncbi:MAG TPA: hypothetical protein VGI89_01590 [Rhizomicrobium sp.]|jgi:hypothetical protein
MKAAVVCFAPFLVAVLGMNGQARSATPEEKPPVERLVFPVTISPPTKHGGEGLQPGDILYSQEIRSRSAVRLTEDHVARYAPHGVDGLDAKGEVTFPAGTLFMLAKSPKGDMYCSARPEDKDTWMTFHDVGVCIRDTDRDGQFDQEVVIGPPSMRQRIAYEMLGTAGRSWQPVRISAEPVAEADLPAMQFTIKYQEFGGGFLSKRRGYVLVELLWPKSMVPEGAGDDTGKWGASIRGIKAYESEPGVAGVPGEQDKLDLGLFSVTLNFSQDRKITTDIATVFPSGPASLFMVGKAWKQSNYKFQVPIVGDVLVAPVEGAI